MEAILEEIKSAKDSLASKSRKNVVSLIKILDLIAQRYGREKDVFLLL
jgi:hypothetical protein